MKYLLSFLLVFIAIDSNACTVCGCSASNQYLGILPQFHRHFLGLQYQHREFRSEHPAHEAGHSGTVSQENFNTLQVGENVIFDGSDESDGAFLTYGGLGDDTLTGGDQNDWFYFGNLGRWAAGDIVNGGAGKVQCLQLRQSGERWQTRAG